MNEGLGPRIRYVGMGAILLLHEHGLLPVGNFLRQTSSLVNCTDCAIIVTTFANALGCDLHEARMGGSFAEQQAAIHVP